MCAAAAAARSSVMCAALTGVTHDVSAGSVQVAAGSPHETRTAFPRVRNSVMSTALIGVTPAVSTGSVKGRAERTVTVTTASAVPPTPSATR